MDHNSEEHFYIKIWVFRDYYRKYLVVPDSIDGKLYFNIYSQSYDIGVLEKNENGKWVWESTKFEFDDDDARQMGAQIEAYYQGLKLPEFIPSKPRFY